MQLTADERSQKQALISEKSKAWIKKWFNPKGESIF